MSSTFTLRRYAASLGLILQRSYAPSGALRMPRSYFLGLCLVLPALLQAGQVTIFECRDAQGAKVYQQTPCPEKLVKTHNYRGDSPENIAAAQRLAAQLSAEQRARDAYAELQRRALASAPPPPPPQPEAKVPCPPTRQNPRSKAIWTDDPGLARAIYRELPSETTLKNTGRWPSGCE